MKEQGTETIRVTWATDIEVKLGTLDREVAQAVAHTESKQVEIKRSWAARLFSWPWRPLATTKTVTTYTTTYKASRDVVRVGDNYYAHPDLIAEIMVQLEKEQS